MSAMNKDTALPLRETQKSLIGRSSTYADRHPSYGYAQDSTPNFVDRWFYTILIVAAALWLVMTFPWVISLWVEL